MGIPAGLLLGIDAEAVQAALIGYAPALVIPWSFIGFGACLLVTVSLVASLWPAIWVARTETLELLQAGRSSA
jgi:ABC-type lipoprotein release transport system permease subunit